ncbi:hypothetical protein Mal64_28510 [Pseudobythopirellula maris]|uniref:Antitoxin ParD4 n=1 Tax=Pseudobythopirellula maris TaxID=2527991 RepID=A0A5C5ZLI7_9BACT|nr:type II toxin-antitoxin system ParD family antitoxin [Pseudobythopirellula maris]TWT87313.1 hypothetical protein Mal64_28510 [Pseudobythopirellula maris]
MIELTPAQQAFVESQVARGFYHDPSEVVQAGIELLSQQAEQREYDETVASVKRGIEDHEAGRSLPVAEAFALIRHELGMPEEPTDRSTKP